MVCLNINENEEGVIMKKYEENNEENESKWMKMKW